MSDLLLLRKCLGTVLGQRDTYTNLHCTRVESLSRHLALRCDLNRHERSLLRDAARLHDVGKIGLADEVWLKIGALDATEWETVKRHPVLGQETCDAIDHPNAAQVGRIVRHHHESFDGSGYPDGLEGTRIPVCARIISLADSYDAMTTTRAYRPARCHEETMDIMRGESGSKSDPLLFELFAKMMATTVGRPEWSNNAFKPNPVRGAA